jgi:tetratricopeptide (TPR) repeat protein
VADEVRLALPREATGFAGRTGESAALAELTAGWRDGPAVAAVITGQAGVGKTSFAVRAAGALAGMFPGGALFVDLGGTDPRPAQPAAVLEKVIRGLAPEQGHVPLALETRAALYRELLAEQRRIVIFDNAVDEAQVRPLLPGDGPSLVLITSRRLLVGLENVHRLPLNPLSDLDATDLLAQLATARPGIRQLASVCGNLPLALRVVGARLASRPKWTPAQLATRLGEQTPPLDVLAAGVPQVSAAVSVSYRELAETPKRILRRMALLPGPDTGVAMATALSEAGAAETAEALEELVRLGLVESRHDGRYRLHSLVRRFAETRLRDEEKQLGPLRQGVLNWLLDTAIVAGRWFEPRHGALAPDWDGRVPLQTAELAERWLRAEAANWFAALRAAALDGEHQRVVDVAEALHWFSDRWIHWGNWTELYSLSATAAQALGDYSLAATHVSYVSWAFNVCLGDQAGAIAKAEEAFALAERAGDVAQQGWAKYYLGWARMDQMEDWAGALAADEEAFDLFRRAGDREGLAQALSAVARCHERVGRFDKALGVWNRQLALLTDPRTAPAAPVATYSRALTSYRMGRTYSLLERWSQAAEILTAAEPLAIEAGHRNLHAWTLASLGEALCQLDRAGEGVPKLRQALESHLEMDDLNHVTATRALLDKYA